MNKRKIIESLDIKPDGFEVVYRVKSHLGSICCDPPRQSQDYVWKEIWNVVDGKLVQTGDVKGTHRPAQYVEESISFG